jgi:uncharacterized protein DUF2442
MMRTIRSIEAYDNLTLKVSFMDGAVKLFDMKPLLSCEAFEELKNPDEFKKFHNRSYFIEWDNEADLSADTLYLEGKSC